MTTAFYRQWSMPSADTFSIAPIAAILDKWLAGCSVVVDPFARNSTLATHTNDLNPATSAKWHMDAGEFCQLMKSDGVIADAVLFDPPYSPRQIMEVYQQIGRQPTMADTQNARLYREVKAGLSAILKPNGIAISFGWNSTGFGKGFQMEEVYLIPHGGAHNDTIVTVERKLQGDLF